MTIQHKIVWATVSIGSAFILWLALYLVSRYSATNMRRIVPWIRTVRRLASWTTLALLLLIVAGFPSFYAYIFGGFSSVLILIDCWAFDRFAPIKLT
jgi:uncharacterized membrane protein